MDEDKALRDDSEHGAGRDAGDDDASSEWRPSDLMASLSIETDDATPCSDPDTSPLDPAASSEATPGGVDSDGPPHSDSPNADRPRRIRTRGTPHPEPSPRLERRTKYLSLAVLGFSTSIVAVLMRLDLILTTSTPTGGDNAAHLVSAWFARNSLLPQGRLYGWTNDTFAGMPLLTYYFPLPIWSIVALSFVLSLSVAFKMTTIAGIVALPFASFRLARRGGLRGWAPLYFASGVFPFLMLRHYRILGGNILSTMAGEFSFSIGLAVAVFSMGSLLTLLRTGKGKISTALLLGILPLCHIVTTVFATIFTIAALATELRRDRWRSQLRSLSWVGAVAILVSAFWTVPFGLGLRYTNSMDYERNTRVLRTLFPLLPDSSTLHTPPDGVALASIFCVLMIVAIVVGIRGRQRFVATMTLTMAITALFFALWPRSAMWNNRFLPFWFLGVYTLGALGIHHILVALLNRSRAPATATQDGAGQDHQTPQESAVTDAIAEPAAAFTSFKDIVAATSETQPVTVTGPRPARRSPQGSTVGEILGALLITLGVVVSGAAFDSAHLPFSWAAGNFAGNEGRAKHWPEFERLVDMLSGLPCGRLFAEPSEEYQKFGSALSMMTVPYWTDSCIRTVDGVYFEASQTAPFQFLTAAQMTQKTKRPQRRLPYAGYDPANAISHLRALGVRYILAVSPTMKDTLRARDDIRFVAASGVFDVFEIADNAIVVGLRSEPVVVTGINLADAEDFPDLGMAQWMRPTSFPETIALDGPTSWARVPVQHATATPASTPSTDSSARRGDGVSVGAAPVRSVLPIEVSNVVLGHHTVRFHVDRIGTPVLVRVSWFPNWRANGAMGPYRVTPNFMVVIPTSNDVTLSYEYRRIELAAFAMTGLGVVLLVRAALRVARERRDRIRLEKIRAAAAAAAAAR